MKAERRPSTAAEAAKVSPAKKTSTTITPLDGAVGQWLPTFSAGVIVDYAAWRLAILDQCSDEALRNIACLASDEAVSMAGWLLEQRRRAA